MRTALVRWKYGCSAVASPGAASSARSGMSDSSSRTSASHLVTSARNAYAAMGAC